MQRLRLVRLVTQPSVQIRAFDDSAMSTRLGAVLASITQARVGGGREAGMHLYLVTGEAPTDPSFEALKAIRRRARWRRRWKRSRARSDGRG